ncbi:hypothetical protein ATCC90586_006032 [Pythium insidiosum]|nr:hypothetical protein ATCC90586_006032 [Pythium insidiosum]
MSLHLPKHHWGTRGVDAYEKLECIGAGTYGQVYMAKNKQTGEVVAIKKIRSLNEVQGLPVTTIREIKVLKCLNHRNLVELKEVVVSSENDDDDGGLTPLASEFTDKDEALEYCQGSIYLVLEYVEHDLTGLIDRQYPFTDIEIKSIMRQLVEVMHHMHSLDIIHRDIKCSNLLLTKHHLLKVADFGLARSIRGDQLFTNKVVTLWYRPPELLLDILFDEMTWLVALTKFVPEKRKERRLREYLLREVSARKRIFPKGALELIESLLVLDPEQRLTAADSLKSLYFHTRPYAPEDPETITPVVNLPPSHEYQTKKIRREQAKQGLNGSNTNAGARGASGSGIPQRSEETESAKEPKVKSEVKQEPEGSEGPVKKRRKEG